MSLHWYVGRTSHGGSAGPPAVTDDAGRFGLSGIDPEWFRVRLEASASGFATIRQWVLPTDRPELRLPRPGSVIGRVVRNDRGCAGHQVLLRVLRGCEREIRTVRTDHEGRFQFDGLSPGEYRVVLSDHRWTPTAWRHVGVSDGRPSEITITLPAGRRLHGRISDRNTGRPIPGAGIATAPTAAASATTDPNGAFVVDGVQRKDGRKAVWLEASGYPRQGFLCTDVGGGPNEPHEFRLRPGRTLQGRVVETSGNAAASVVLRVAKTSSPERRLSETLSGADGTFCFECLPDTRLRLVAEKEGFAVTALDIARDTPRSDLVLRLSRGASITGRVGDSNGQPIPAGEVHLSDQYLAEGDRSVPIEGGRYRIDHVPAGSYRLVATARGYARGDRFEFLVADSPAQVDVDFRLGRGRSIEGAVTDENQQPVPDALVSAISKYDGRRAPRIFRRTRTDERGRFRLTELADGSYGLVASRLHESGWRSLWVNARTGDTDVRLQVIRRTSGVKGVVRSNRTGAAIAAFTVSLAGPDGAKTRRFAHHEGRFRWSALMPGTYRFTAVAEDGRASVEPVVVQLYPGVEAPHVELRVTEGTTVRGVVRTPDGKDPGRTRIALFPDSLTSGEMIAATSAKPDGSFVLQAPGPGRFRVRATHPDWVGIEVGTLVGPGAGELLLNLLERGGTIELTAREEHGSPAANALVTVRRLDGSTVGPNLPLEMRRLLSDGRHEFHSDSLASCFKTDRRGRLTRRFVPPGQFVLEVRGEGGAIGRSRLVVHDGVTVRTTVTIQRGP